MKAIKAWFKDRPKWERSDKKGLIRPAEDCTFFAEIDGKITSYTIPRVIYDFDGASIPRIFWPVVGSPFDPQNLEGATPHDPLYLSHALPRWIADEIAFQLWLPNTGLSGARLRWGCVRSPLGALAWRNGLSERAELAKIRAAIEDTRRKDIEKFRSLWFAPEQ